MSSDELYAEALTPNGTRPLSCEQFGDFLTYLRLRGSAGVQSVEAYETIQPERQPLRMDWSILGLDGDDDWEVHRSIEKSLDLAERKLAAAKSSNSVVKFLVWIDDEFHSK
jgi:hypothetical protein